MATPSLESSIPEEVPGSPSLRVLCLHEEGSSATELKDKLDKLGQRLYQSHGIDLIYVNSPLVIADQEGDVSNRVWWEEEISEGSKIQYRGLDASLLLARQVWTSLPIQGVIGFGQGAAVASMLCLFPNLPSPPQFAVFVDGVSLLSESQSLVDPNFPCLHLQSPSVSSLLTAQFDSGTIHQYEHNSLGSTEWNLIGKFLVAQKVEMRAVVTLQTSLQLAEAKASQMVAEYAAKNPPASLMAIIQPQAVAGWSGNRRRQPNEEGGGAPCPSEFKMRRQQRPTSEGPNRMHPDN